MNLSEGERLILVMLCDIHKALNLKGAIDPDALKPLILDAEKQRARAVNGEAGHHPDRAAIATRGQRNSRHVVGDRARLQAPLGRREARCRDRGRPARARRPLLRLRCRERDRLSRHRAYPDRGSRPVRALPGPQPGCAHAGPGGLSPHAAALWTDAVRERRPRGSTCARSSRSPTPRNTPELNSRHLALPRLQASRSAPAGSRPAARDPC